MFIFIVTCSESIVNGGDWEVLGKILPSTLCQGLKP